MPLVFSDWEKDCTNSSYDSRERIEQWNEVIVWELNINSLDVPCFPDEFGTNYPQGLLLSLHLVVAKINIKSIAHGFFNDVRMLKFIANSMIMFCCISGHKIDSSSVEAHRLTIIDIRPIYAGWRRCAVFFSVLIVFQLFVCCGQNLNWNRIIIFFLEYKLH